MKADVNNEINFIVISKFRTQLMGIAGLFIMLCHNSFSFTKPFDVINSIYLTQLLQCGVDIFMILSGIGCYYSYNKSPVASEFYKKRAIRIFPTYILFVVLKSAFDVFVMKQSILDTLYNYSLISFFISGNLTKWFIAAILVLYLLFPLIYKFINKSVKLYNALIVALIALTVLPIWKFVPSTLFIAREIFFTRIPAFLVGTLLGKKLIYKINIVITKKKYFIIIISEIIFLVFFSINALYNNWDKWTISRLLFLPISLCFMILISCFFEKIKIQHKKINKLLMCLGSVTLETYLIHGSVLFVIDEFSTRLKILPINNIVFSILNNILAIIICVTLAYFFKKIAALLKKGIIRR